MPDRGIDLHRIDTKCAVTSHGDNGSVRHGESSRHSKRHADTEAAESSGVHINVCAQSGPRETQEIATIRNGNVVRRSNCRDRIKNNAWMNFSVVTGQRTVLGGCAGGHTFAMTTPESLRPFFVDACFTIARSSDHGIERQIGRGEQFRLTTAVIDKLAGVVSDAHEMRVGKYSRRPITDLVIQLAAD